MSLNNHLSSIPAPSAPSASAQMPTSDLSVDYSAYSAFLGKQEFIDCVGLNKRLKVLIDERGEAAARASFNGLFDVEPHRLAAWRKFASPTHGARIPKGDDTFHDLNTWERYAAHHNVPLTYQGVRLLGSTKEAIATF